MNTPTVYYRAHVPPGRNDGVVRLPRTTELTLTLHDINHQNPRYLDSWPTDTAFTFSRPSHPKDFPSFAGIRIISTRFKNAIVEALGPQDRVQFFPATINFGNKTDSTYWIMYFPDRPDVLDLARSERIGPAWGRIALDSSKLDGHEVFALPTAGQASFVVSETARMLIEEHGIEGIQFNPIAVS